MRDKPVLTMSYDASTQLFDISEECNRMIHPRQDKKVLFTRREIRKYLKETKLSDSF